MFRLILLLSSIVTDNRPLRREVSRCPIQLHESDSVINSVERLGRVVICGWSENERRKVIFNTFMTYFIKLSLRIIFNKFSFT